MNITNQVLRDDKMLVHWWHNTSFLNRLQGTQHVPGHWNLNAELMNAFGNFKWESVDTFAEINSIDADIMLVESSPDAGMATVLRTPRVQNVSHHIKTPVTTNLNTGTQTLVKTPRGTVSPRYKFDGHQPSDIASIFTGLQARTPIVFEWAGQIDNGLAVFAVARVTERDRLYNGETVEHFLHVRDGLDGSLIIGQQSALPACANAYSTWLSKTKSDLRYTHKSTVDIDGVVEHLAASLDFNFKHVVEQAERMANFYVTSLHATRYFERVLLTQSGSRYGGKVESVDDIRRRDDSGKELPHRRAFERDLQSLQDCWRNGNGQADRAGLHKAFHAVTFWANHLTANRAGVTTVTERNTRQMMPGGNRDKIINSAFNIAMSIAA